MIIPKLTPVSNTLGANLQRIAKKWPDAIAKALTKQAELIATRAKSEFVPVDDGHLKNSIRVEPASERDLSAYIVAGGPDVPYALAIHEHLSSASPPSWRTAEGEGRPVRFHPSGRGPKYIEKPLYEAKIIEGIARDANIEKLL